MTFFFNQEILIKYIRIHSEYVQGLIRQGPTEQATHMPLTASPSSSSPRFLGASPLRLPPPRVSVPPHNAGPTLCSLRFGSRVLRPSSALSYRSLRPLRHGVVSGCVDESPVKSVQKKSRTQDLVWGGCGHIPSPLCVRLCRCIRARRVPKCPGRATSLDGPCQRRQSTLPPMAGTGTHRLPTGMRSPVSRATP